MPNTPADSTLKFTSLGTRFWDINKGTPRASFVPSVILKPNGEPLIKMLNFSDEEVYYPLEELWALKSGEVMDRFGRPTRLGQEAFYRCATIGAEIIRQVWKENGYSNKGETARSTKVKSELSPIANTKSNRKAPLEKGSVLPKLRFGIHNNILS